jgi:hypothetical protein
MHLQAENAAKAGAAKDAGASPAELDRRLQEERAETGSQLDSLRKQMQDEVGGDERLSCIKAGSLAAVFLGHYPGYCRVSAVCKVITVPPRHTTLNMKILARTAVSAG